MLKDLLFTCILSFVMSSITVSQLSLTTTFAGGNGQLGNMFDIVVENDLTIFQLDVNVDNFTSENIRIYYKPGTYLGSEMNSGAWTLLTEQPAISQGTNQPTPIPIPDLFLSGGGAVYGFYVTMVSSNFINYTNGTTEGDLFVSDANMKIYEGIGTSTPLFGSNQFSPRVWNGTIHYFLSPNDPEIPTLSQWGMIILGLSLVIIGKVAHQSQLIDESV